MTASTMTDRQLLDLAQAVIASDGRPRPRIGSPYCLVCHEEPFREQLICDGCAPRVIVAMSKALVTASGSTCAPCDVPPKCPSGGRHGEYEPYCPVCDARSPSLP